ESCERIIVTGRSAVDDSSHVVGVAPYPTQSRKMIDCRCDASPIHSVGEGRHLGGNGPRRRTVTTTKLADWPIEPDHVGGNNVGDRCQIGVDAGCGELATPVVCVPAQLGVRLLGLPGC